MSAQKPVCPAIFEPPHDWEPVYAASPAYHFGEEPSQIARTAVRWFESFGGEASAARVLDLGSGEGRDTAFLAGLGFAVTARDSAPSGLAKTRALLARRGISESNVDLALGDVREYAFPKDHFHIALAANVFQFLPPADAPTYLERLKAATEPGGLCAVGVFSPAMGTWGANISGFWTQTADDLLARFAPEDGWLALDRTEYWTYREAEAMMASFAYVVARKKALA